MWHHMQMMLLTSCFWENDQNPNIRCLIPFNPHITIFPHVTNMTSSLLSNLMKKQHLSTRHFECLKNLFWLLFLLNAWVKIFYKFSTMSLLFILMTPTSYKISELKMSSLRDIRRQTFGKSQTRVITKGDYWGTCRTYLRSNLDPWYLNFAQCFQL